MSSPGRPAAGSTRVLDIGCGLGDNAVYLAKNGHTVTGLDISPTALKTAEQRAKDAGVDVKFAVADSTKLDGYTDAFDTVIDSGLFHSLDDNGRRSYAAAVHRATRPGATLLLSCFSDANPVDEENRDRRCPKRRCATSSAAPAGTSPRWRLPRCAANWTARQSTWRSGISARTGAKWIRRSPDGHATITELMHASLLEVFNERDSCAPACPHRARLCRRHPMDRRPPRGFPNRPRRTGLI